RREYVETLGTYRNRDGGFWVASTDPQAADHALTGTTPADQVGAAGLLTDGAADAVSRYRLITWRQLLNVLTQDGPTALIRRVREAERSDPHGERWPRSKTFDDATAAYCRLQLFDLDSPRPVACP
ncbi:hypothetical protein B1L11_44690, partial [Microbispora sp. GKU 823]